MTWSAGAFATTETLFPKLVAAWPEASSGEGAGGPKPAWRNIPTPPNPLGVGFAALGAPGVELRPTGGSPWASLDYALRYDLPALDEAFGTAGLPKVAEDAPADPDGTPPTPEAVATALDWPQLAQFWSDQARKRQLALAIDSYLAPFSPADARQPPPIHVDNLIQGARLEMTAVFDTRVGTPPYGALTWAFGGAPIGPLHGNELLPGLDGALVVDPAAKTSTYNVAVDPRQPVQAALLGFTPSTFDIDGYRYDNAGIGVADPVATSIAQSRPLRNPFADANNQRWLVSAAKATAPGLSKLSFWFRDAPVNASGLYGKFWKEGDPRPETAVDFGVWLDPLDGLEWRLAADPGGIGEATYRLPFQGFALEPLRLLGLQLTALGGGRFSDVPERVQLLARLSLGQDDASPPDGEGLVALNLVQNGAELALDDVVAIDGALRFTIYAERRVGVTARPTKPVRGALGFSDVVVELPFHGHIVQLSGATFGPDAANPTQVALAWNAPGPQSKTVLRIESLRLTASSEAPATLTLDYALYLWPSDLESNDPPIVVARSGDALAEARVLGAAFAGVDWRESDGAAAATYSDTLAGASPIELLSFDAKT